MTEAIADRIAPLVVGASGTVGRRLLGLAGPRALGTFQSRPFPGGLRFDAERDRLRDLLAAADRRFTHAILLFGIVRTDQCAADYDATWRVNVAAMRRAIDDAVAQGVVPVFVSSDYVFDGSRGNWRETDPACPNTAYGRQKAEAEAYLQDVAGPWLIVRLSKIVTGTVGPQDPLGEWVGQIREGKRIRCATDQVFCPMHIDDAAALILRLCAAGETGIWHVAGRPYSRIALLKMLMHRIHQVAPAVQAEIETCSLHDFPFREKRPLDTSMSTEKLRARFAFDEIDMDTVCRRLAAECFAAG